jgi:hypothetical protein
MVVSNPRVFSEIRRIAVSAGASPAPTSVPRVMQKLRCWNAKIVAVSSTADAAKKGKAKKAKAAPVASLEPSDAQRVKFWQDAFNPAGAK